MPPMCTQEGSQARTPPADHPSGSGGVSVGPSFRPAVRQLPAAGGRAPGNDLLRRGSAVGGVWMEALAPGPAPRGRRRARASGSVLSALSLAAVVLSALLRAPPAGEARRRMAGALAAAAPHENCVGPVSRDSVYTKKPSLAGTAPKSLVLCRNLGKGHICTVSCRRSSSRIIRTLN